MAIIQLPSRSKTQDRFTFITDEYVQNILADLRKTEPGQAVLVGDENGYTGGKARNGKPSNGKGTATSVGEAVKRAIGQATNVNTKVHAIPSEDGKAHFAALSLNRAQPDYAAGQGRTRNRKSTKQDK